jgi:hypothetical protein
MIAYTKCKTQKQAIADARKFAIDAARDNDCNWTEKVFLMSGDTMYICADITGKITVSLAGGWDRDGHIFCGPKAYSIAQ